MKRLSPRLLPAWLPPVAVAAALSTLAVAARPAVERGMLFEFEKKVTKQLQAIWPENTYLFESYPHAHYIDHFGVVLTAEVSLVTPPGLIGAFHRPPTPTDKKEFKSTLLARIPKLREGMKTSVLDAAVQLDTLSEDERIAAAVIVYHFYWEDTSDIPSQIVVQGKKKDLVAARANPALLDQAIEMKDTY